MNRTPYCPSAARPLRTVLATALLSLSFGAAIAVPEPDDYIETAVFEQNFPRSGDSAAYAAFEANFPRSGNAAAPARRTADLTDNELSEALFQADAEVVEVFVRLAGLDPLRTP